MTFRVLRDGDDHYRQPSTIIQKGNRAPEFCWSTSAVGRTMRISIACGAYHLGYDDVRMGRQRQFPDIKEQLDLFNALFPYGEGVYNEFRRLSALAKGYLQVLEPFEANDVHNRLHYLFAEPGKHGHSPKARKYGISKEHHDAPEQSRLGGRSEVWARCSTEVLARIRSGRIITFAEAEEWGRRGSTDRPWPADSKLRVCYDSLASGRHPAKRRVM